MRGTVEQIGAGRSRDFYASVLGVYARSRASSSARRGWEQGGGGSFSCAGATDGLLDVRRPFEFVEAVDQLHVTHLSDSRTAPSHSSAAEVRSPASGMSIRESPHGWRRLQRIQRGVERAAGDDCDQNVEGPFAAEGSVEHVHEFEPTLAP